MTTAHPSRRRVRRAALAAGLVVMSAGVLTATVAPASAAGVLYVGGSGCSDAGTGTATAPYCTIGKAALKAVAGTTVQVSAGTYPEVVSVTASGTADAPVVFQAAPGASPVVSGGTYGFSISSKSWVTVRGFTVQDTVSNGIYLVYSSNVVVSGNRVQRAGQRVNGYNAQGIYVKGTTDSAVTGNVVDDNSAQGIYLTGTTTRVTVSGNESMRNAFGWQRNANGIDVRAAGNTIVANRTHDNEDSGIQLYPGGNNNVVAGNRSWHNKGFTTTVLTNCSHPSTGNTAGCFTGDHGIDDYGVTGNQITGNTVYDNNTAGINVEGIASGTPSGFVIKNNVSADNAVNCLNGAGGTTTCPATKGNIRVDSTSQLGTVLDRDVVWTGGNGYLMTWGTTLVRTLTDFRTLSGQEPAGRQADPALVAPAAGDLRLSAGSPAIDMADGTAVGHQDADAEGLPRVDDPATADAGTGPRTYDDAGALEYQPPLASASPTASATPTAAPLPPSAPVLTAVAGGATVHLSWSPPAERGAAVTGYTLYRGSSPGGETQLVSLPSTSTSYDDPLGAGGATVYYQLSAGSDAGESARSAEVAVTSSPISYVGGATTPVLSGSTAATVALPAGVQPGDLLVAWLAFTAPASAIGGTAGWTQLPWSPLVDGTNHTAAAYYRVAQAGDPALSLTWTTSSKAVLGVVAYRGVDQLAPVDASGGLVSDGVSSAAVGTPTVGAPDADDWAVSLTLSRTSTSANKGISWTPDAALGERVDANTAAASSSPWVGLQVADSGGPVATGTHRYTATASYAESHHDSALLLLNPARGS